MPIRALEGRYVAMLTVALCGLVPYILVTTAYTLFRSDVIIDLGADRTVLEIISGVATAAYCFGALLGGDLILRFKQRNLFLIMEGIFVIASLLCAFAVNVPMYATGRILEGLMTGLMLVVALPPVIQRFGSGMMPITAAFVNIGFFGAIMAGPLMGGVTAIANDWRLFYAGLAGLGAFSWILALISLPHQDPPNPDQPFDYWAIVLGAVGTVLPFWASGELTSHGFASPWFYAPMTAGLLVFVLLIVVEYRKENALAPVHMMANTFPIVGTLVAMVGGGALVTLLTLAIEYRTVVLGQDAWTATSSLWPQVLSVLIAAAIVGWAMRTRFLPVLALVGMLVLIGAGGLQLVRPEGTGPVLALAAAAMLGLGAGLTVTPGLFMAGMSLPPMMIGRIFALVELVRSLCDFILAPVILKIARLASDTGGQQAQQALTTGGIHEGIRITLYITASFMVACLCLYLAGTRRLQVPNLSGWLDEGNNALESPPLFASFRS